MKITVLVAAGALAAAAGSASAVNVYVLSSGDPITDAAVVNALVSHGHTVSVGVPFTAFDGTQSLAGFQTVYLQANANWSSGDMPAAGQAALVTWVNGGGRLITSEWVLWKVSALANFQSLAPILPHVPTSNYGAHAETTFVQQAPSVPINAGLPSSFTFQLDSYAGTETLAAPRPGATAFYASTAVAGVTGLAGWGIGSGTVFSFTITCGPVSLADSNFGRLFSNVMGAPGGGGGCYANCDSSTIPPVLNVLDFSCFLNKFAAGHTYANCDGSTIPPVLNVLDFSCFLNKFAAGCP
jgi:hypothetical protein